MSSVLDLGTLRGFLDLDDTKLDAGLESAGDKISDFGSKGAKIAGVAGVAIAGAMVASLVKGMNIDAANDKLAASLALTEKQAARAGEVAGRVYAGNYGESLEDVNTATAAVISSIKGMRKASDAELEGATKAALNYASVFEIDVQKAVSVAGVVMKSGLAKNSTEAFDLLTAASQRVPAQLREDVLDAAEEYSQFFKTLGYSGEEAFSMLVEGSKKGMYGIDKAGDAIKEFTIRATDMSASSKGAYKSIGLDAREMSNDILAGGDRAQDATQKIIKGILGIKDPSKQAQAAIALFGTPLEDLNVKEIPAFLRSMQSGGDAMKGFQGSAKDMDKTLNDNAISSLESLKRQGEMAFGSLMNFALPIVDDLAKRLAEDFGPALEKIIDIGGDVVGFFTEHETLSKSLAVAIGALVVVTQAHAAVLAVAAAGGLAAFIKQLPIIVSLTKVWTAVQWAMNAALTANPIGIIIAVIAALVIALVVAYKKSETFRTIVQAAFRGIADAGRWMWNNVLQPVFKALVEGIAWIMDKFGDMLQAMSHVPGFGWAKTAADAMHNAAGKARELADNIKKIPPRKDIYITFHETTIRSIQNKQANDPRLNPHGATGGIVTHPTWALIGEAGPEMVVPLNRTPGSSPLPRFADAPAREAAPLIGHLEVIAQPGADRADIHNTLSAVVYQVGLAQRSGRWGN